jgi:hypothetical protein
MSAHLLKIPEELFCIISSFLSNKEIKRIRLANRECSNRFRINKFERVYISPNKTNLEAFYAVLDHPLHRTQVEEIVWDDAMLTRLLADGEEKIPTTWPLTPGDFRSAVHETISNCFDSDQTQFALAKKRYMTGLPLAQDQSSTMTLEESMSLYRELYEQQLSNYQCQRDAIAFRKGLAGFPALRRITLTSEAHRPLIHRPYHKTPMIRSLPVSFIYPCPLPWRADFMPWREDDVYRPRGSHGLYTILREFITSKSKYTIPEFIIETKFEDAGILESFFDGSSYNWRLFEHFMQNQGLRRFGLALLGQKGGAKSVGNGLKSFPFVNLRRALSQATMMESFSLSVGAGSEHHENFVTSSGGCRILTAVPINSWPSLRHLTLGCVPLVFRDFMRFLSHLPPMIDKLAFVDVFFAHHYAEGHELSDQADEDEQDEDEDEDRLLDQATREQHTRASPENWDTVLEVCRSHLDYRANKPRFAVAQSPRRNGRRYGPGPHDDRCPGYTFEYRRLWVEDDIARFFEGGSNPFSGDSSGKFIQAGFGVWRDDFDESFERPNWRFDVDGDLCMTNQ